jgi:hypothetical protein
MLHCKLQVLLLLALLLLQLQIVQSVVATTVASHQLAPDFKQYAVAVRTSNDSCSARQQSCAVCDHSVAVYALL